MTEQPHERPEFFNAVTYAVTVTITVEGGRRRGTADRRARKVAERLANAAARTPGVVEVTATAGWTSNGKVPWPERVGFAEANTAQGGHAEVDKLDRYLDPDHEFAMRSLAEENAAAERRRQADRERRRGIGCHNTYALIPTDRRHCKCVYCRPDDHYREIQSIERHGQSPFCTYRCLCGIAVAAESERCLAHRRAEIVVLEQDDSALQLLAQRSRQRSPDARAEQEPPEQGLEL